MFFWDKPTPVDHPPLRGVNLGGWLVLEKWITPSLFNGQTADDEYGFCNALTEDSAAKLKHHRDSFITREDFIWLKEHGIEAVRIPIGSWIFGDETPYQATIDYVDEAFAWAEETGIYILLDMHGAPGSQNGKDHSGRKGDISWADDEQHIIKTLSTFHRMAKRYSRHPKLLGFELLNEPKPTMPKAILRRYYKAAYAMLRHECGPNIWIVISDGFRPRRWNHELVGEAYPNVIIDTHQYQSFDPRDKKLDIMGHLRKTAHKIPRLLGTMRQTHPVIIGEWSLALDPQSLDGLDASQLEAARRAYGSAQLLAYSQSSAWFFWTYRTENGGVWSYRDSIERGWLPKNSLR